eukprot:gene1498-32876_t
MRTRNRKTKLAVDLAPASVNSIPIPCLQGSRLSMIQDCSRRYVVVFIGSMVLVPQLVVQPALAQELDGATLDLEQGPAADDEESPRPAVFRMQLPYSLSNDEESPRPAVFRMQLPDHLIFNELTPVASPGATKHKLQVHIYD